MAEIMNIKILTLEGEYISLAEWQQQYGLQVGSKQIGKYYSYTEDRFMKDHKLYGALIVNEPLIMVIDEVRRLKGSPQTVSSFNRNAAKQAELKNKDPRVAHLRASVSTHEFKIAADLDCKDDVETMLVASLVEQAAKNKNIKVRIGFKDYLEQMKLERIKWNGMLEPRPAWEWPWTFVHVDTGPEYFAPGKPWHNKPHPKPWEVEARW